MVINIALHMVNETISRKSLEVISRKLKKMYPNWLELTLLIWIDLIAAGISEDNVWKTLKESDCTRENARHISMGTIKSQFHRRVFMRVAASILLSVEKEAVEIKNLVSQTHKIKNGQRQIKSIKVH